jgi:hypothetical protein
MQKETCMLRSAKGSSVGVCHSSLWNRGNNSKQKQNKAIISTLGSEFPIVLSMVIIDYIDETEGFSIQKTPKVSRKISIDILEFFSFVTMAFAAIPYASPIPVVKSSPDRRAMICKQKAI